MELLDIPDERALPFIQDYKVFLIEQARMTDKAPEQATGYTFSGFTE